MRIHQIIYLGLVRRVNALLSLVIGQHGYPRASKQLPLPVDKYHESVILPTIE